MKKINCLLGLSVSMLLVLSCDQGVAHGPAEDLDTMELIQSNQEFKEEVLDNDSLLTTALATDSILEGVWNLIQAYDTLGNDLPIQEYVGFPTLTFQKKNADTTIYRSNDGCNKNGFGEYELDAFDGKITFSDEVGRVTEMLCLHNPDENRDDFYKLYKLDGDTFQISLSESNDTLTLTNPLPDTSRVSSLTFIRQD